MAPDEPWKKSQQISIKNAKKAISDYKKATNNIFGIMDLMLFYVECGNDFKIIGFISSNYSRLLDTIHADKKLYLVFEYLDMDLKRYMEMTSNQFPTEIIKVIMIWNAIDIDYYYI